MAAHVELYEDESGGFRWRRVAGNGEVTGQGESYTRRSDAREAAAREYPGLSIFDVEVEVKEPRVPEPVPPPEDAA